MAAWPSLARLAPTAPVLSMQRSRFLAALLAAGVGPRVRASAAPLRFAYPNVNGLGEAGFGFRALRLALQRWGQPFELVLSQEPTNSARSVRALAQGEVDVMDLGTGADLEARFQAIYLPLDRGLSGWRLLVIRRDAGRRFAGVQSLQDLAAMTAGQGMSWSDVALLRAAGLRVTTAEGLGRLFSLLQAGRFDYLPLGLNEVDGFVAAHRAVAPDAVIEPRLALRYPFARLFYVRRDDDDRHAAISAGLGRAFEDGSFSALFAAQVHTQAALAAARLAERQVLQIANAGFTEAARAMPARYFIRP